MSNLSPKFTPTTYRDAHKILEAHNYRDVTLCYATTLTNGGGDGPTIVHHNTPIVTWHLDGSITLNGGGWVSRTTADRMHRFTPANVRVNARNNRDEFGLFVTVDDVRIGSAQHGILVNV